MPGEDQLKDLLRGIAKRTKEFNNNEEDMVRYALNEAGTIVAQAVIDYMDGKPGALMGLAGQ